MYSILLYYANNITYPPLSQRFLPPIVLQPLATSTVSSYPEVVPCRLWRFDHKTYLFDTIDQSSLFQLWTTIAWCCLTSRSSISRKCTRPCTIACFSRCQCHCACTSAFHCKCCHAAMFHCKWHFTGWIFFCVKGKAAIWNHALRAWNSICLTCALGNVCIVGIRIQLASILSSAAPPLLLMSESHW